MGFIPRGTTTTLKGDKGEPGERGPRGWGSPGSRGPKGPPGPGFSITATSAELLSGHRVIVIDNGIARYPDTSDLGDVWRPLHFTIGAMSPGVPTEILAIGDVTEGSWSWPPGIPLYVGSNGMVQDSEPIGQVWTRIIALTNDATSIFFKPNDPIVLAA